MRRSGALPMTPEELLEAAVLLYLRGLGLPEADRPRTASRPQARPEFQPALTCGRPL